MKAAAWSSAKRREHLLTEAGTGSEAARTRGGVNMESVGLVKSLRDAIALCDGSGTAEATAVFLKVATGDFIDDRRGVGDKMSKQAMAPAKSGDSTATAAKRLANALVAMVPTGLAPPDLLGLAL